MKPEPLLIHGRVLAGTPFEVRGVACLGTLERVPLAHYDDPDPERIEYLCTACAELVILKAPRGAIVEVLGRTPTPTPTPEGATP